MSGMSGGELASYYQSTIANGDYGTASTLGQQQRLAARFKLVLAQMPDLAQNPNAVLAIANSPYSDADLAGHAAAIGASSSLDGFLSILKQSGPAGQRAMWGQLTDQQRKAATQLGYSPPHNEEGSWFAGVLSPIAHPVGTAIGDVLHAGEAVAAPVVGPALGALKWVSDQPAHAYRAIATDPSALLPLVAAGAAVGGVLAAPFTGGFSLGLTAAAIGGGALAGATVGAAVTNPSDWWDAYQGSWDGETTFRPAAQAEARALLTDDRVVNLAKDVSWAHDQTPLFDLASQLAGKADADNPGTYDKSLQKVADRTFTPGTPEHDAFYSQLRDLATDPTFKEAVQTLQEGKISPGRDLASAVGLDPSQGWGRVMSGATDGLWLMTLDPTLVAAKASEAFRVARYGFDAIDKDAVVAHMVNTYGKDPGFTATIDTLTRTANAGARGFERLRNDAPHLQTFYDPLIDWARANNLETVTANDTLDWMTQSNQVTDMLLGKMARPGERVLLPRITRTGKVWASVKWTMKDAINAANDADIFKMQLRSLADRGDELARGIRVEQTAAGPTTVEAAAAMGYSAGMEAVQPGGGLYGSIRALADIPVIGYPIRKVGTLASGLTTMAPERGAISLVGPQAAHEIDQFTELYRTAGMQSWVRSAWKDAILAQQNDGQRLNAINQFTDMAFRVGGIDRVNGGEELINRFRDATNKAYYLGSEAKVMTPLGEMPVGQLVVLDQAYDLPIPNIGEIRRAAQRSGLLHDILGIADTPLIDTAMNRIWKPSVLLRIGFIPRVAGDEMLAWIARNGVGSVVQSFAARAVGEGEAHADVAEKFAALGSRDLLDAEELARLDHWRYLAHVRPLERIANRVGFGKNLTEQLLGGYSDFVRSTLNQGVAHDFVDGLSERARQLISPEGSIRDLFFHGVTPDLHAAAKAWTEPWAQRVMEAASSNRTGAWDNEWTGNNYGRIVKLWDPRKGTIEDTMLLPMRGNYERKYLEKDPTFMSALHSQYSRYMDDPFQGPVIRDFFTQYMPDGLRSANVNTAHAYLSDVTDPVLRQMLIESATGEPNALKIKQLVGKIRNPNLQRAVYGHLPLGNLTPEGVQDAVAMGLRLTNGDERAVINFKRAMNTIPAEYQRHAASLMYAHDGAELPLGWKTDADFRQFLEDGLKDQAAKPEWMGQLTRNRQAVFNVNGLPVAQAPARGVQRFYFANADPTVFQNLLGQSGSPQQIYQSIYTHLVEQLDQIPGAVTGRRLADVDRFARQLSESGPAVWDEMIRVANESGHGVTPLTVMAFDDPRVAEELSRALQSRWSTATGTAVSDGAGGLVRQGGKYVPPDAAHYSYADLPEDVGKFRNGELYGVHRPHVTGTHRTWMVDSDAIQSRVQIVPKSTPMVRTTRGPIDAMENIAAGRPPEEGVWYHGTVNEWYDENPDPTFAGGQIGNLYGPGLYMSDTPAISYNYAGGGWNPTKGTNTLYRLEPVEPWKLIDVEHPTDQNLTDFYNALDQAEVNLVGPPHEDMASWGEMVNRYWQTGVEEGRYLNRRGQHGPRLHAPGRRLPGERRGPDDIGARMVKEVPRILADEYGYHGFTHTGGLVTGGQEHRVAIIWDPEAAWVTGANKLDRPIVIGPKVPGISYEEATSQRMEDLAGKIDKMFRANVREDRIVPTRAMEHTWHNPDGSLYEGQGPTEQLVHKTAARSDIYDDAGAELPGGQVYNLDPMKGFKASDGSHVDPNEIPWEYKLRDNGESRIMHEIFSPMVMDHLDEERGFNTFEEGARVLRSQVKHVIDTPGTDLPNVALGPLYAELKGQSTWDKFTRFGFNRVMGPAIDAIIRKPLAFHNFAIAHRDLDTSLQWLRNPDLLSALDNIAVKTDVRPLVAAGNRAVKAAGEGDIRSADELTMWVRGLGDTQAKAADKLAERAAQLRARGDDANAVAYDAVNANLAHIWGDPATSPGDRLLQVWGDALSQRTRMTIPSEWTPAQMREAKRELPASIFDVVSDDNHAKLLQAAWVEHENLANHVRDLAVDRAIAMTVPFIHSHHFRSQFADEARNFLPFQFAEENMLKRWAKTLRAAPDAIERGRLAYEGMKSGGMVRTDAQGQDWFVYPGSGLLMEALGKVPGFGDMMSTGSILEAKPEQMLPGLQEFGAPRATPLVSIPMQLIGSQFPDLKPVQDALLGQSGTNQGVIRTFFPASVVRLVDAFTTGDSDAKFASAMASAAKILQANGQGLPENATDLDVQDFLEKLRGQARTILVAQALTGFIVPGAPTATNTSNPGSLAAQLTGVGIDNPAEVMSADYMAIVRQLGIQDGTLEYLKEHPQADPWSTYSTLALSEPLTKSGSGARIPITQASVDFFDSHQNWINGLPNAGPWFIPPAKPGEPESTLDRTAYDELLASQLRQRQTPEEFVRSMYFKVSAQPYFTAQDSYKYELAQARTVGQKRVIQSTWDRFQQAYLAAHPLFSTELQTGDGAQRRQATIKEMRVAVNDPEAPVAWHTESLKVLQNSYDRYAQMAIIYGKDRQAHSVRSLQALKLEFQNWADRYVLQHPEVEPYWRGVLSPEANLPDVIPAESAA